MLGIRAKLAVLGAIALAVLGFFKGRSGGRQTTPPVSHDKLEEISDERAEKIKQAGDELADNLAADPATQRRRALDWLRKRTGGSGT